MNIPDINGGSELFVQVLHNFDITGYDFLGRLLFHFKVVRG